MSAKKIPTKLVAIIGVAVVAVITVLFFMMPKEEAYRQVQVYKVDGTADVERQTVGILEAYDNMMLQNQDIVNVSEDSNMQVKLDEDKYILLEPKTKIHLEATGTSEDSKTKIYLEEGAIVCNIENALSEKSTYEVNTPNSTMAVRGTTFRVAVEYDELGNSYTTTAVFDGKVESFLVYPDGSVSEESLIIEKGTQVLIKGTEEDSLYIVTNREINYEDLKKVTLEFLNILLEKGEELSITEEDIHKFIEQLEQEEVIISTEETENNPVSNESATEESELKPETTDTSEDIGDDTSEDTGDDTSEDTEETTTYIVTFTYNGTTFATQKVASDNCATEPKLMPTASGYWDFDFSQKITANTTVTWVEE